MKEKTNKKIAIIIPYFGKFKPSVNLFLESCKRNPEVDWFIFTDCDSSLEAINENIHWICTTLEEIKDIAVKKLNCSIALERAYKLCDLRPFYGIIFADYLQEFDYWGYGDLDVINGRLYTFLNEIGFSKYDKINWMGHLSLVKNNDKCNFAIWTETNDTMSAKEILATEANLGIDERGFNKKCLASGMKIYTGKWAADMDMFYGRMRCVDKKTLHYLLDTKEVAWAPTNYEKQLFAVIDGAVYRLFIKDKRVQREEFAYIHFRKEAPIMISPIEKSYIVSRKGFFPIPDAMKDLNDVENVQMLIQQYNGQGDLFHEMLDFIVHFYRKVSGKRGW